MWLPVHFNELQQGQFKGFKTKGPLFTILATISNNYDTVVTSVICEIWEYIFIHKGPIGAGYKLSDRLWTNQQLFSVYHDLQKSDNRGSQSGSLSSVLSWLSGMLELNRSPSLMLLATPVLFLLWQIKMSASKSVQADSLSRLIGSPGWNRAIVDVISYTCALFL